MAMSTRPRYQSSTRTTADRPSDRHADKTRAEKNSCYWQPTTQASRASPTREPRKRALGWRTKTAPIARAKGLLLASTAQWRRWPGPGAEDLGSQYGMLVLAFCLHWLHGSQHPFPRLWPASPGRRRAMAPPPPPTRSPAPMFQTLAQALLRLFPHAAGRRSTLQSPPSAVAPRRIHLSS